MALSVRLSKIVVDKEYNKRYNDIVIDIEEGDTMNEVITINKTLSTKYAAMLTGQWSERTRTAYASDIKGFFRVNDLSEISIEAIKAVDVAATSQYREELVKQGYAQATINRKLTALSSFYTFLCRHEVGIMEYNPFSKKEGLHRVRYNKRYSNTRCLTMEECDSMLTATVEPYNPILSLRNRIIVLTLASTGMRRAELVSIKLGMFKKMGNAMVIEIVGKGEKERLVKISQSLYGLMGKYLEMRGLTWTDKSEHLFVGHSTNQDSDSHLSENAVYLLIKKIARRAGLDASDISPHCFRHFFVTEGLAMGRDLATMQDCAGHADISTTRRYDHTRRVLDGSPTDDILSRFQNI